MPGNRCYVPESGGEVVFEAIPSPAAGSDWIFVVPDGFEYLFTNVTYRLTTDATAHTHTPSLQYVNTPDGSILYQQQLAEQIESVVRSYYLSLGNSRNGLVVAANNILGGSLPRTRVLAGNSIGSSTVFMDAGDTYTFVGFVAKRWKVI
jgi:hypothetical protein